MRQGASKYPSDVSSSVTMDASSVVAVVDQVRAIRIFQQHLCMAGIQLARICIMCQWASYCLKLAVNVVLLQIYRCRRLVCAALAVLILHRVFFPGLDVCEVLLSWEVQRYGRVWHDVAMHDIIKDGMR